jgi:ATP-binding cassette subfamily F protein 3
VLQDVRFSVRAGDRIGMLGINGAGKSTLVKALAGSIEPQSGSILRGTGLAIGYFAQHQVDHLRPQDSPLDHLRRIAIAADPGVREQELRDFLGRFLFGAELAAAPVGPMSGGEKARLALALIAWLRPNLLLLDEPTNHLDIEAREALTLALASFEGAMVLVSHDRYLLRATVDSLWLVHDGRVGRFDGDLDDYARLVMVERRGERASSGSESSQRETRRRQAEERQRRSSARRPLQKQARDLETEMSRVGTELKALDRQLASAEFYNCDDRNAVAAALKTRGELAARLEAIEAQWLQLQIALEAIA